MKPVCPNSGLIIDWLNENQKEIGKVVNPRLNNPEKPPHVSLFNSRVNDCLNLIWFYEIFDLNVSSSCYAISNGVDGNKQSEKMTREMLEAGSSVGIGIYNEIRFVSWCFKDNLVPENAVNMAIL